MATVNLEKVVKRYGPIDVVHGIDLEIEHGEFVVLVGPSGCGKSTTLRMIAGLEEISDGAVKIGDRVVNDLPPRDRNVSMVFQNYALYPHMTVAENLGFSLKIAKRSQAEIDERVTEAATILGLGDMMDRLPGQLSGGQRQRVAMGRAIVRHPDVFLFDEPLSNLDAKLRTQMRTEIKKLHQKVQTTVIYVTHDQIEAMTLADRIVIMRGGHIEQVGSPMDIFHNPANLFVAQFIGSPPMNLAEGIVGSNGSLTLASGDVLQLAPDMAARVAEGTAVTLGIRAEDMAIEGHGRIGNHISTVKAQVNLTEPLGNESLVFFEHGGAEWVTRMFNPRDIAPGETITLHLNMESVHLFDKTSEKRL
ncbi:ABC transporter ATP-binding protein [Thalassospira marina]|uniref:Sugar ABC transporter ATP-binding protein n=1 Tax=Thalassospira marina TaxID=2048283 RepID=A0A2N3KQZ0_9PROT|nr:sn-glycerol-3-phosphate ABC transporter ATP-binding protein UgpC [Thalassospira marina]AUG55533.1 sugar ABC transporter ATP-binding protein [Thalassospira marina]PKR52974.1 sugar ABC transporter ATP-binding protein [Thalassospira marina]